MRERTWRLVDHASFIQRVVKKPKKKIKSRVPSSISTRPPPVVRECLMTFPNGATFHSKMVHPAFTPGKVMLLSSPQEAFGWIPKNKSSLFK